VERAVELDKLSDYIYPLILGKYRCSLPQFKFRASKVGYFLPHLILGRESNPTYLDIEAAFRSALIENLREIHFNKRVIVWP
jgi:hypothetical protein